MAAGQKRLNVPPYIQLVVALAVRVKVEAAPLAPNVNVKPARLTTPEVIVRVVFTVVPIPRAICGMVANVLFKVRLLNVVEVVPPKDWAAVPLNVTVAVPGVKAPLLVQLPATEIPRLLALNVPELIVTLFETVMAWVCTRAVALALFTNKL